MQFPEHWNIAKLGSWTSWWGKGKNNNVQFCRTDSHTYMIPGCGTLPKTLLNSDLRNPYS